MAFIPTAGAVRTDLGYVNWNQSVHNILWFSRDGNWTETEREGLNTAIAGWWETSMKSNISSSCALASLTTVNQENQNAPASTLIISPVSGGTISGLQLPTGTALCATLRTDLRGRNYRGRMYLPGIPLTKQESATNATNAYIADLLTALAALKTVIEGLGAIWVVVSHYLNKVARANGVKTPITAISMDSYFDSQRRRLGLRGA